MENITIRPLTMSDIPKLGWTGDRSHVDAFVEQMRRCESGAVVFIGAQQKGDIVGRCGIDFERFPNSGFLWMFNVRDDFQNQGIGTLLMDACEANICLRNISEVRLNVEKGNIRAQALYIRRGYEVIGEDKETWEIRDASDNPVSHEAEVVVMQKLLDC